MSALQSYGHLIMFGKNSHNQLGVAIDKEFIYNQDNYTGVPTLLPFFNKVIKISCGVQHTGLITHEGNCFTFGAGAFGKLGLGDSGDRAQPTRVLGIPPLKDLCCGNDHTIALTDTGIVYTWGSGSLGRLGVGKTGAIFTPTKVSGFKTGKQLMTSVYAGGASSGAIQIETGALFTWGYNKYGQLGINNTTDQLTPVIVPFFSGGNDQTRISSFAIGDRHMAAIVGISGELYCWGNNEEYQLGDGSSFNKHVPTNIKVKPYQRMKNVECGGGYTCATGENGSFWVWGAFVKEYLSNVPKLLIESGVQSFDCSSDCGRHVILTTERNEVFAFGWNRYGQAANEDEAYLDTVPISRCDIIAGKPSSVSTGSYHSALLYNDPSELLAQLIWCLDPLKPQKFKFQIDEIYRLSDLPSHHKFRNYNGDSILHLIAKKKYSYIDISFLNGGTNIDLSINFQTLNNDGLPPFWYNAKLLLWPIQKTCGSKKSDIDFTDLKTGDNCLHYYAKKGLIDEFAIGISVGVDHSKRNKNGDRPFDLLDKQTAFNLKSTYKIYDIGLVYTGEYVNLVNQLKQSLQENLITVTLISDKSSENRNCTGYVFFVSSSSLTTPFQKDLLLNFISKGPMVSIWAEKTKINDPTLESCIFRSQLVDFSSHSLYNESFSVLLEGVYNMFAMKDASATDGQDEDSDNKNDIDGVLSVSGSESIFISCDPNNVKKFKPLFDFFKKHNITIIPREKKVISSWVVVVIISDVEFTPLIRDEISLAENRGKPLIPIYFTRNKKLDQASRYTFSNSPTIPFTDNGFNQLLLLIKLHFKFIHQTEHLLKIKNK